MNIVLSISAFTLTFILLPPGFLILRYIRTIILKMGAAVDDANLMSLSARFYSEGQARNTASHD